MAETKTKTQVTQIDREVPYQSISIENLTELFFGVNGATFAQFYTETIPKMRKRNNPFWGKVKKNSRVNVVIDFDYESNVNAARIKEAIAEAKTTGVDNAILSQLLGQLSEKELATVATETTEKFEVKPRQWGKHMVDPINGKISRIMIDHTNKQGEYNQYVQLRILSTEIPVYRRIADNEPYTGAELVQLKTFFPAPKKSTTQELYNEIILRDYGIANIRRIHINKRRFAVDKSKVIKTTQDISSIKYTGPNPTSCKLTGETLF